MIRIVVIDDEYMVVEGLKALISRYLPGYQVEGWAYDGLEGLTVVRELRPDIVITDIRIPGMDGLSLIETAKEFCPDTSFVVISGYTEFEYARRALSLGVKGYIDKPVSREKLSEVLKRIEDEQRQNGRVVLPGYEELDLVTEKSIRCLIRKETEAFQKSSSRVMELMGELCPDVQDFRRETYKYLCVVGDVLVEEQPRVERDILASFKEMEKQRTKEEVFAYSGKILRNVSKYLTANRTGSGHQAIAEVLSYIERHYNEDIGLGELASLTRMSTAYLSVLFKAEVGESFIKYLTELRLRKAKELLKEGYKVKEVSDLVGYSNYRYFCDIFKKNTGRTPHEYKESVWGN